MRDYWEYIADKKEIEDVSAMYRCHVLIINSMA